MDSNTLFEILKNCAKNDRLAQKELYKQYFGFAMNIAMRYASSYNNAVEMVNDGFLKIFNDIGSFQSITTDLRISFSAWVKRVVINASIDHIRKYRKKELMISVPLETTSLEEYTYTNNDTFLYNDIMYCIQQLPVAYKTVFNLYVIEGFAHKEIAEILNINEGTSKSNLFKARQSLKNLLNKKLLKNG